MASPLTLIRATVLFSMGSLLTLSACTPIFPTDNPPPYPSGKFAAVEVGSSGKAEVAAALGRPHLTLRGGELWIYGRSRVAATNFLGAYDHDYQAIFVEFDDGKVVAKDLFHSDHWHSMDTGSGCWAERYELCLHPGWRIKDIHSKPRSLSRTEAAVTTRGQEDTQAKRFTPTPGSCSVYVFRGFGIFSTYVPVVTLGEAKDEPVPRGGFLYYQSSPGLLRLLAGRNSVDINCQANTLHFFAVSTFDFGAADDMDIEVVSEDEGREAVMKRHLLVTW